MCFSVSRGPASLCTGIDSSRPSHPSGRGGRSLEIMSFRSLAYFDLNESHLLWIAISKGNSSRPGISRSFPSCSLRLQRDMISTARISTAPSWTIKNGPPTLAEPIRTIWVQVCLPLVQRLVFIIVTVEWKFGVVREGSKRHGIQVISSIDTPLSWSTHLELRWRYERGVQKDWSFGMQIHDASSPEIFSQEPMGIALVASSRFASCLSKCCRWQFCRPPIGPS